MKKLTKAQQTVVDKMREGWELRYNALLSTYYLYSLSLNERIRTEYEIFQRMYEDGIIEFDFSDIRVHVYRLTEQYKTAPAGKQV